MARQLALTLDIALASGAESMSRHDAGFGVEGRRVPVAVRERLRRSGGQFRGLSQHLAHRVAVEVAERCGGQNLVQVEYLEEVELEISHVALVMTHVERLSSRLHSS